MKTQPRTKTKHGPPTANADSDEINDTVEDGLVRPVDDKVRKAKEEIATMDRVLDVLAPLSEDGRMRVVAAAAILAGVVPPDATLRELARRG